MANDSTLLEELKRNFGFSSFKRQSGGHHRQPDERRRHFRTDAHRRRKVVVLPTSGSAHGRGGHYHIASHRPHEKPGGRHAHVRYAGGCGPFSQLVAQQVGGVESARGCARQQDQATLFRPRSLTKEENVAFLRNVKISFYAIDEDPLHPSEWGHDFRPEYRRIRPIIADICPAP